MGSCYLTPGGSVYTPLSGTQPQPTSNAAYTTAAAHYPDHTPVSPAQCTASESVTSLDTLVVAPCSSPLKADTPCTSALTVLQPASHAHAATHHAPNHAHTHVHTPSHAHVPMHAHAAVTPDPTYTALPPITHYAGKPSSPLPLPQVSPPPPALLLLVSLESAPHAHLHVHARVPPGRPQRVPLPDSQPPEAPPALLSGKAQTPPSPRPSSGSAGRPFIL